MNELLVFKNSEFGEIRTVNIDGTIYFVGSDVAKALGYAKPQNAIASHCRGALKHSIGVKTGVRADGSDVIQNVEMLVISEGDLYRLIMRSQLPSAMKFESWVCDTVLPQIRQTGVYIQKPDSYTIEDPVARAERWIEEQKERKALSEKVEELTPKAHVYDKMLDSKLLVNFRDAAKEIGISQSQFTGWLKENGYIYATSSGELRPMEQYRASGLFEMKPYQNPYNGYCGSRTFITPRGLAAFKIILDTAGYNQDTMKKHGGKKKKTV